MRVISMGRESKATQGSTLCWDCENATSGNCPWAMNGTPVPGWIARPDTIYCHGKDGSGRKYKREIASYTVYECPKFKRDAWRGGQIDCADNPHPVSGFLDDPKDMRSIAASALAQAIEDWKALDYGRISSKNVESLKRANSAELREFFESKYFEELLALCTEISPQFLRKRLMI